MDENLKKLLSIRYIKLHFTLEVLQDCVMPVYKTSALRGGMGEMLLRANCIRDRKCDICDFESECIVQRTMYSKLEKRPAFMTAGDSVGYVIECEDYNSDFHAGERFKFNLILFGRTLVYFNLYMQAIAALGMNGLGSREARFRVSAVTNSVGEEILNGQDLFMEYFRPKTVDEYVSYRVDRLKKELETASDSDGISHGIQINFKTPLSLKYHNEFLNEFNVDAIISSLKRRIYILDCFEGINDDDFMKKEYALPGVLDEAHEFCSIRRYSNRKQEHMFLKGIKGHITVGAISDELMEMLTAGELLHIGKNTSFGFGRYQIKSF